MFHTHTLLYLIISHLTSLVHTTPPKARPMGQMKVVGPGHSIWTSSLEACVKYCDASDQCDAINYHSTSHKCRLFAPCTHVYSMYGSLDYYFYSKRPQILDHGFVFDKERDTCIKLMEIGSDMSQGDRVCTRQNGRLLNLSPSSQDIAVELMIRARQRPKFVWTGGGEPWDWKSEFTRSTYSSNQDPGEAQNPPLCSVLEITGQWLRVPCDQGSYMSLCEVPAFYTLVKYGTYLPTQHGYYPPTPVSYPTVSFPSYDALTPPPGTYPTTYHGREPPQYPPDSNFFPYSGNDPSWGNIGPPYVPPGYIPFYGAPVNPPHDSTAPPYPAGTYPPPTYPLAPATQPPPTYPPSANYPAYGPPPTSNHPVYPTSPSMPSPPATYSIPAQPPPTNPPQHYPNYTPDPATPSPPYPTYSPPAVPQTPPTTTYPIYIPPVTPTPIPSTPNYPTYSPPAHAPPSYPVYPTPSPAPSVPSSTSPPYQPPQYFPTPPAPSSHQPPFIPSPTYRRFPFSQLPQRPKVHFLVPQNPAPGYPSPPYGARHPPLTYNTPSPTIYYHQPATHPPNPNTYHHPYPTRPNCVPPINERPLPGYDCQVTSPPLTVSTFPPAINPYFPPLLIYQPGYQNPPPTPHYKGYVPPAAHPTNILYRPLTDFLEKPLFQGKTYIVKGDMAYEIPTQQRYHGWERDYILSGRSVDHVDNNTKGETPNTKIEQNKLNNATTVPNQNTNTNKSSFYYSNSNYLSNSFPNDQKNISETKHTSHPGHSTITNTTVINKNSTFSTNVEYTKNVKPTNRATIEIQGGRTLTKIMPSDGKWLSNRTTVVNPAV